MIINETEIDEEGKRLCLMPNGYSLYVKTNKAGGRIYFSDEIGGGVEIWDTCCGMESSILFAITIEDTFNRLGFICVE